MSNSETLAEFEPYALLRASLALFQKTPSELNDEQLEQASSQARNECELENRVLNSPEAGGAIVTEQTLSEAVQAIRDRFPDEESFGEALSHNELDQESLRNALFRQCKVENVLESIASKAATVSDVEVDIYYHMHPEKFNRPEQRSAKHILITINDDFAENSRDKAQQRITEIAEKLHQKPQKFADLALKYSECPTAMQGGELGTFSKGQLYPEIEASLFALKEGQISDIIETEVGFHIVQCIKIHGAETMSLKKAQPKIRKLMQERSRRNCQRAWLASLPASSTAQSANN